MRGFRGAGCEIFLAIGKNIATGDSLLLSIHSETLSVLLDATGIRQRPNSNEEFNKGVFQCGFSLQVQPDLLVRLWFES
jgi:hypothetical protein